MKLWRHYSLFWFARNYACFHFDIGTRKLHTSFSAVLVMLLVRQCNRRDFKEFLFKIIFNSLAEEYVCKVSHSAKLKWICRSLVLWQWKFSELFLFQNYVSYLKNIYFYNIHTYKISFLIVLAKIFQSFY